MDFVTSQEMQSKIGTELLNRPVREEAELADFMKPMEEITIAGENMEERAENLPAILERFNEIYVEVQE